MSVKLGLLFNTSIVVRTFFEVNLRVSGIISLAPFYLVLYKIVDQRN